MEEAIALQFILADGPKWLPVVGNFLHLKNASISSGGQYMGFLKLAKEFHTDVLGLKLGKEYVVVVFSYSLVKTVLTSTEYDGRPDNFFIRFRTMGTRKGVVCTDGEFWTIQRSFVVKHLRNLGFGKKPMEAMIKDELDEMLTIIDEGHSAVEIKHLLPPAVINVLWTITAGMRIPRTDARLKNLLELLGRRSKAFDMSGGTLSQQPWLRFVAPEKTGYNLLKKLNSELKNLFMDVIHEHYESWSRGRNDDLIYSFITEIKQAENDKCSTFTDEQLVMVCLDIFIAGSQTTGSTVDFAILMMILYPDVQQKAHTQFDEVLNQNKELEYADRLRLPYIEAILLEVQRFCHVIPVSGPRRVIKDTTLDGYNIPKDTTVLIHLYSVHMDKQYWGDPEVFRPERFLDEDGKLIPNERLIPFGLGRRRCLGDALARCCIFMFFAGILRRYRISVAQGSAMPTGKPLPGITLSTEAYKAMLIKRHK